MTCSREKVRLSRSLRPCIRKTWGELSDCWRLATVVVTDVMRQLLVLKYAWSRARPETFYSSRSGPTV